MRVSKPKNLITISTPLRHSKSRIREMLETNKELPADTEITRFYEEYMNYFPKVKEAQTQACTENGFLLCRDTDLTGMPGYGIKNGKLWFFELKRDLEAPDGYRRVKITEKEYDRITAAKGIPRTRAG